MTYKVLSSGFPSGYTLSSGSAYTGVSVTATGSVGGSGLLVQKAGAVVINSGQLLASGAGNGVYLTAGGLIRNRYGGLIEGLNGVFATHGGSVVNYGTIIGGGAGAAVDAAGGATTVVNGGTIACVAGTVGVSVSFANAADRLIVTNSASFVGEIEGGGGTLELDAQYGTVSGLGATAVFGGAYASGQFADFSTYEFGGSGVWILNGVNSLAAGQTLSVQTGGGDYVRNQGSLAAAAGAKVQVSGGYLFNGSMLDTTAQISTVSGVYVQGFLANYGVIDGSGGYSVRGVDSSETLIVEAGAKFIGKATADGGTIVFNQGGGTITGLGGAAALSGSVALSFGGFGTYEFDAGAWTLDGPGALAANDELVDFGNLGIFGTITNAGAIVATAGGTIDLHGAILGAAGAAEIDATEGGVFNIDDGSVAQVQGKLTNTGTIALLSAANATDLRILAGGASLTGGGTLTMSGPKARILGETAASTLTNVDNTIIGVGSVGVNDMTLINQAAGVIEATGLLTVRDAAGHSLTNSGLIEANSTGKLALVSETINQAGGGTILAAGGLVTLQGVDLIGGTLTTTGAGHINVDGAATLDGSVSAMTNSGLLQVTGGQTLTVDGNVANGGKLDLHAARLLIGAAGATLSGAGQVNLSDNSTNVIVGAAAGTTLTNVNDRIAGSGNLGGGQMVLVNQSGGQIIGNQGVALTIDTGSATITNAGLIENSGKGGTLIKSAVVNSGTLAAVTAGTLTLAGAVTGAGVAQINGGTLYVQQAFAENVTFTGSTGVLKLGDSQAYTGQITGLSKTGTNTLDLADIAFSNTKTKASFSGTTASGTLTVTDGTHTAHITLIGNYVGSTFTVSTDGHTGTKVVDPASGGGGAPPLRQLAQVLAAFGTQSGATLAPAQAPLAHFAALARPA